MFNFLFRVSVGMDLDSWTWDLGLLDILGFSWCWIWILGLCFGGIYGLAGL